MLTELFLSVRIVYHFIEKINSLKEFYELLFAGVVLDQDLGAWLGNV